MAAPYFPLFVNLTGKRATIIGGGDTAFRKAKMLISFGASVRVISPDISDGLVELVRDASVLWLKSSFSPKLLAETDLLVAATNLREVNHEVYEAAREQRILLNVCDSREESSFIFPAVICNDAMVAGVVAVDENLNSAKKLARKIIDKLNSLR